MRDGADTKENGGVQVSWAGNEWFRGAGDYPSVPVDAALNWDGDIG